MKCVNVGDDCLTETLFCIVVSMFTHDCVAKYDSNAIIKFAEDTMMVGLIDDDETA